MLGLGEDIRRKQMCWAPPVTDPRDGERQIEHCTSPSMEGTNRCLAKELCPSPQPFHPGLQPTRGAALVHGSSPLKQSSLEGLYSHTQKSSFTNFLSISWPHQATEAQQNLCATIIFCRIHPKATRQRGIQRCYIMQHYVGKLTSKLTKPGMVAHSWSLSI